MMPVIPHFSNECIKILGNTKIINWPEIKIDSLINEKIKYVIQINGKTRQIIEGKNNLSKEDLINLVKKNEKMNKYINQETLIKNIIFVPNKLINILIN